MSSTFTHQLSHDGRLLSCLTKDALPVPHRPGGAPSRLHSQLVPWLSPEPPEGQSLWNTLRHRSRLPLPPLLAHNPYHMGPIPSQTPREIHKMARFHNPR